MSTTVTAADLEKAVTIALAQEGKPYSQSIPARFGTKVFDCSGLVWYAMNKAGIPMPGGASDDAAAIVDPEIQWAASQPGAKVITNIDQVQRGDIVGFYSPDATTLGTSHLASDGKLQVGNTQVESMGHIGIASGGGNYISAYDTASGIINKPIATDHFVVAVRLAPGVEGGSSTPTSGGSGSGSGGIISWPSEITGFFSDANTLVTKLAWLAAPASWVRIVAFLAGVALLLFAIHALIAAGKGEPLVSVPPVIPVPV